MNTNLSKHYRVVGNRVCLEDFTVADCIINRTPGEADAYATFICEALNVEQETGMTPRELANEYALLTKQLADMDRRRKASAKTASSKSMDWAKYENVCFAILGYSTEVGWVELARPKTVEEAWRIYEAHDWKKKIMLNFGLLITEQE